MADVVLGQSYFLRFDPKLWAAMQPYPPLGTLYAASYLRERGYDVALFDAMLAESEAEWDQALERARPRFAVLYEDNFNYLSKMCLLRMREAAFRMIAMARARGCTVIVAGSDPTDRAELYLARGASYVTIGEGAATLAELLDHLKAGSANAPESIAGLALTSSLGVRNTPRRPDLRNLDQLPFPAWDLVEVERFRAIWQKRHGYFSMNLATSRGCPYHCNWCAKPIWGQRYNVRSPENVVAEIAWLSERFQPDHLWIVDDIFGLKPGWIEQFANLVQARGVRIPFKSLQRADLVLKGNTIPALRRAGAKTVWIGAESGSQKILDAMDKGTRVEQIRSAARQLKAAGIEVGFFLQFGYPGETRPDVELTLQLLRECRPDDVGVSVSYPLPGTAFHRAVQVQLGGQQNWQDSSDLAMLYRGPFTTGFYRKLHQVLHHEFRARNTWDQLRRLVRRPSQIRPIHLRRAVGLAWHLAALPVTRWQLDLLARQPYRGLDPLPVLMTPSEAAQPTAQKEEAADVEPSRLV